MESVNLTTPEVSKTLQPFNSRSQSLLEQVERAEVRDGDDAAKMADLIKVTRAQKNKAEDARKGLVKPLNDHVKWINAQFKPVTEEYDRILKIGNQKYQDWAVAEEERQRKEAEERRRQQEDEALAAAEGAENEEEAEQHLNAASDIPETHQRVQSRGDYGATGFLKSVTKFRVTDYRRIPAQFLEVDPGDVTLTGRGKRPILSLDLAALKKEVDNGNDVPGIEIYEDKKAQVR